MKSTARAYIGTNPLATPIQGNGKAIKNMAKAFSRIRMAIAMRASGKTMFLNKEVLCRVHREEEKK